ncbi:hypothetical protein OF83DRAFT_420640 [Amylostereum chailletii]|nr:hypothetical protein OF83DRAFT_420640 [Amylostereum chailletii]
MASVFDRVPNELLEHIAHYAVTSNPVGPPVDLTSILLVNRRFASSLSDKANPRLYALIFADKFDLQAYVRRLGVERASPTELAAELKRRFSLLRRFRSMKHCNFGDTRYTEDDTRSMHEMLWLAYLMLLESDGMNELQLRQYARLDLWLRAFWFDADGASCSMLAIDENDWPPNNDLSSLAMWCFWFMLRPEDYSDDGESGKTTGILKLLALGAHQYPICRPAWADYLPQLPRSHALPSYGPYPALSPPPLAAPAILSYLTLSGQDPTASLLHHKAPLALSSVSSRESLSRELETEWHRCLSLAAASGPSEHPSGTFSPGSMEGIWEGLFTYTDFTAYAQLLGGAPPRTLSVSVVARHQQTFRLREYHLLAPEDPVNAGKDAYRPLSAGDPLRAHLPIDLEIQEDGSRGMYVREPGRSTSAYYSRARERAPGDTEYVARVREVLIAGEGHSAWGQFNLIGRIRPSDGFIALSKEYLNGERGNWLYRGYLVGDAHGNMTGRWRDTLSPPEMLGYEGCFFMGRRR